MTEPTVLIVPGLRDHVAEHWQTWLAERIANARTIPPIGRDNLALAPRLQAMEREVAMIEGPLVLVAHSGGVALVAHWARQTRRAVHAALLATPPNLDVQLPSGYPGIEALRDGGWLPVPRVLLPFTSVVAASRNDPLARFERVAEMARDWGARLDDIGEVGHLNPASGYGPWPRAMEYLAELTPGLS